LRGLRARGRAGCAPGVELCWLSLLLKAVDSAGICA
jgi:hypothetical protein